MILNDDSDAVVAQVALSAEEACGGGGGLVHSYVDFHRDSSENRRLESCAQSLYSLGGASFLLSVPTTA